MLDPPDAIKAIWEKPGREWTGPERDLVKTWLNSNDQLKQLRELARHRLGWDAPWVAAEDCWQDFNAGGGLDNVINSYDPAEGEFPSYLCVCFKQFCWKWAGKEARTPSGPARVEPPQDEEGERLEWVFVDEQTPAADAESKELGGALRESIARLDSDYSRVVTLLYFEHYSVAEIAKEEGISDNLVKVRLLRARQQLKKCLQQKGLRP